MPTESQQYVRQRLDELSKYRDFKEQLRQVRQINQARTAADLDEIDLRLRQLVPPKEWNQTDVALLRQERLDDIKTIREEADKIENWYRDLKKQADALWASDRSGEGRYHGANGSRRSTTCWRWRTGPSFGPRIGCRTRRASTTPR